MEHWIQQLSQSLTAVPPIVSYVLVAFVIGLESMGVPLPGEIVLIASLLVGFHQHAFSPIVLAVWAALGATIGDNIGYFVGHKWGKQLLAKLGKKHPKHFGPERIEKVEHYFQKYGVWAVFFGRFVALLRILSGPVAGTLRIKYWKFLIANLAGAIVWVTAITSLVWVLNDAAGKIISRGSWILLLLVVVIGILGWIFYKKRAAKKHHPSSPSTGHNHAGISKPVQGSSYARDVDSTQ